MHYYQFNIGDYASHTQHLDEIEDLAYRRMLDYCYLNECGLPESVERIAKVIRMPSHCHRIADVLREYFTVHTDGTYRQARIDKEIDAYKAKSKTQSANARKRWENADAMALPLECERNAKQETLNNNHKPLTNTKDLVSPEAQQSKNGSRLPVDWILPDDWMGDAKEIGLSIFDALNESIIFRDYWIGVAGAKGRKADWRATWRNWVRRKAQDRNNQPKPTQSHQDNFIDKHTDASWADGVSSDWRGNPL